MKTTIACVLSALVLSACTSLQPIDVVNPSEVSLDSALASVGKGLKGMLDARGDKPFGLIPSEIEVQFRIAANAKDQTKLVVDLSRSATPELLKKETKLGGEVSQSSEGIRDNTIRVRFLNLLTIPEKTLGYEKPEKVEALIKAINGGVVLMQTPPNDR